MLPGHVEVFSDPGFRAGRRCWIYLPPSYQWSTDRYPVLYAVDGEAVFDGSGQIHANRICEDLIRQGEIRPIIIVAIENASPGQRFWELAPWHEYTLFGEGGGGAQFLLGIRDTLKPSIDRHFRTLPDPANTAIAGVSLGGLFAGYAGILHSGTFGNVAAFSPSYWLDGYHLERMADTIGYALPGRIRRYYQDTGTDDNYIDGMTQVLLRDGFWPGVNFLSITADGGEHAYGAWSHRYPEMLKFLFPPQGGP